MAEKKMTAEESREDGRPDALKIWVPAVAITLIGLVIAWQFVEPAPPKKLRIATGSTSGTYYRVAKRYAAELKEQGYELEVVSTGGSVENLRLLDEGSVDLAFVQGGTVPKPPKTALKSYCSLYFEPLWVFVRQGGEATPQRLNELISAGGSARRIAVGSPGSGTKMLAEQVLARNGITEETAELVAAPALDAEMAKQAEPPYTALETAYGSALIAAGIEAECLVGTLTSKKVRVLLRDPRFALLPMPSARPYKRECSFLSEVSLPAGMLSLQHDLPARETPLLAPAATLVARADLSLALVPLVLDVVQKIHNEGGDFEGNGQFPSARYLEPHLPIAEQAETYLEEGPSFLHRVFPFGVATTLQRLKVLLLPLLTLLFPIVKIAPPIIRFRIRYKIFRWYRILRDVDQQVLADPSPEEASALLERLRKVDAELGEVKVPLSYMGEFYSLRLHLDLVMRKLIAVVEGGEHPTTAL